MAVSEVVGVYDADGGLRGEAAYAWGRLRGPGRDGSGWREVDGAAELNEMAGSLSALATVLRRRLESPA